MAKDITTKKPGPKEAQLRSLRESKVKIAATPKAASRIKAKALAEKISTVKANKRG